MLILLQWSILSILAIGWGYGVALLLPAVRMTRMWLLYVSCAGLPLAILASQDLVYVDVPVRYSAWIVFGIGLSCSVALLWHLFQYRSNHLISGRKEFVNVLIVVIVCAAVHGMPVFLVGPDNYYGTAHEDQANYVLLAQFLKDEPFSTTIDSVGSHPWLVKAIDAKEKRIGQSVCIAIVAAISGTDAKTAYGATSVFFILLLSAASYAAIRRLSLPRWTATGCAIWIGVLPSLTRLHLDGFLSNVSVLFCFPALCGILIRSRRLHFEDVLLSAIIAAFVLSCYTEVYVIAVMMVASLIFVKTGTVRLRLSATATVVAGSCVLLLPYLRFAARFSMSQFGLAMDPNALASLFPRGGTLEGWGEIFLLAMAAPVVSGWSMQAATALAVLFLNGCAFLTCCLRSRIRLLGVVVVPVGILLSMLVRTEVNRYPFAKLSYSFGWLWCTLAAVGLARLTVTVRRSRRYTIISVCACSVIFAALLGTLSQLREVVKNNGILATVNSPEIRDAYRFAEHHPERTYLIKAPDNIMASWLAFHARKAKVYLDPGLFDHRYHSQGLSSEWSDAVLLTQFGFRDTRNYVGSPELVVHNPQGRDMEGRLVWFWVGGSAGLEITGYNRGPGLETFRLSFWAGAGPANPSPHRVIEIAGQGGSKAVKAFETATRISMLIGVRRGRNLFQLNVVEPREQLFHVPLDPRNHMVRIQEFTLAPEMLDSGSKDSVVIGSS